MAFARIISHSRRYSQELALDLLERGYAVEIVPPGSAPENQADLEFRVESEPDLLSGTVRVRNGDHSSSMDFAYHLKDRMVDVGKTSPAGTRAASFSAAGLTAAPTPSVPHPIQSPVPVDVQQLVAAKVAEQQAKLLELPFVDTRPAPLPLPERSSALTDVACTIPVPLQFPSLHKQADPPPPPVATAVGQVVPVSSVPIVPVPATVNHEPVIAPRPAEVILLAQTATAKKSVNPDPKPVAAPFPVDRSTPPKPAPRPTPVAAVCPIPPPVTVPTALPLAAPHSKTRTAAATSKSARAHRSVEATDPSRGWLWRATLVFLGLIVAGFSLQFGVHHQGPPASLPGPPAPEHLLTPLAAGIERAPVKAQQGPAEEPKPTSSRANATHSRSHGRDYVAANTITYLDRPGAKPVPVESLTHNRSQSPAQPAAATQAESRPRRAFSRGRGIRRE